MSRHDLAATFTKCFEALLSPLPAPSPSNQLFKYTVFIKDNKCSLTRGALRAFLKRKRLYAKADYCVRVNKRTFHVLLSKFTPSFNATIHESNVRVRVAEPLIKLRINGIVRTNTTREILTAAESFGPVIDLSRNKRNPHQVEIHYAYLYDQHCASLTHLDLHKDLGWRSIRLRLSWWTTSANGTKPLTAKPLIGPLRPPIKVEAPTKSDLLKFKPDIKPVKPKPEPSTEPKPKPPRIEPKNKSNTPSKPKPQAKKPKPQPKPQAKKPQPVGRKLSSPRSEPSTSESPSGKKSTSSGFEPLRSPKSNLTSGAKEVKAAEGSSEEVLAYLSASSDDDFMERDPEYRTALELDGLLGGTGLDIGQAMEAHMAAIHGIELPKEHPIRGLKLSVRLKILESMTRLYPPPSSRQ